MPPTRRSDGASGLGWPTASRAIHAATLEGIAEAEEDGDQGGWTGRGGGEEPDDDYRKFDEQGGGYGGGEEPGGGYRGRTVGGGDEGKGELREEGRREEGAGASEHEDGGAARRSLSTLVGVLRVPQATRQSPISPQQRDSPLEAAGGIVWTQGGLAPEAPEGSTAAPGGAADGSFRERSHGGDSGRGGRGSRERSERSGNRDAVGRGGGPRDVPAEASGEGRACRQEARPAPGAEIGRRLRERRSPRPSRPPPPALGRRTVRALLRAAGAPPSVPPHGAAPLPPLEAFLRLCVGEERRQGGKRAPTGAAGAAQSPPSPRAAPPLRSAEEASVAVSLPSLAAPHAASLPGAAAADGSPVFVVPRARARGEGDRAEAEAALARLAELREAASATEVRESSRSAPGAASATLSRGARGADPGPPPPTRQVEDLQTGKLVAELLALVAAQLGPVAAACAPRARALAGAVGLAAELLDERRVAAEEAGAAASREAACARALLEASRAAVAAGSRLRARAREVEAEAETLRRRLVVSEAARASASADAAEARRRLAERDGAESVLRRVDGAAAGGSVAVRAAGGREADGSPGANERVGGP